jgi:hypothetical protein
VRTVSHRCGVARAHLPDGWHLLTADAVVPPWWEPASAPTTPAAEVVEAPVRGRKRKAPEPEGMVPLFGEPPAPAAPQRTVGAAVVDSEVYEAQRAFVPKPPAKDVVAAVIDALVEAGARGSCHGDPRWSGVSCGAW